MLRPYQILYRFVYFFWPSVIFVFSEQWCNIVNIHSLHLGASVSFAREVSYHGHCPYFLRNNMLRIVLLLVVMCQKPIICHDSPDCLATSCS